MSKFVSGGSLENPTQRDDEWLKAQQELEEKRRVKAEQEQQQHSGKTLYETLQENKGGSTTDARSFQSQQANDVGSNR